MFPISVSKWKKLAVQECHKGCVIFTLNDSLIMLTKYNNLCLGKPSLN
jgi:hypothetical protein